VKRTRSPRSDAVVPALMQLGLAVLLAIGAVLLIGTDRSARVLVATAALAGGAGALLGSASGASVARSTVRRTAAYSSLMFAALGLTAGAGGYLLAASLIVGDVGSRLSSSGAAGFGLLVGALAGRVFLLVSRQPANAVTAIAGEPGGFSSAFAYLDEQVQERLFGPALIDYDGKVFAAWYPAGEPEVDPEPGGPTPSHAGQRLTLGHVRLVFVSGDEQDANPRRLLASEDRSTDASLPTAHALVRVHGGASAELVPFTLAVRGYPGDAFPTRVDLAVPATGVSELVEFTLVRSAQVRSPVNATSDMAVAPLDTSVALPGCILIDISQAGTTIQLVEVRLDVPPSVAPAGASN
jgi:hypothetical protein